MESYQVLIDLIDKRIEEHNRKIEQAIQADNHYMKTICKAERAEACIIRGEILKKMK